MTEIEQINIPVYRTPGGTHTCASDSPGRKVCPFLMTKKFGTDERCFFYIDMPLQRMDDGFGWLIPSDKCPIRRVAE